MAKKGLKFRAALLKVQACLGTVDPFILAALRGFADVWIRERNVTR